MIENRHTQLGKKRQYKKDLKNLQSQHTEIMKKLYESDDRRDWLEKNQENMEKKYLVLDEEVQQLRIEKQELSKKLEKYK